MDIKVLSSSVHVDSASASTSTSTSISPNLPVNDEELARQLYEEELKLEAHIVNDDILAQQLQEHYDKEMAAELQTNADNESEVLTTPQNTSINGITSYIFVFRKIHQFSFFILSPSPRERESVRCIS
jgi:hypothetical protein